MGFTEEQNKYYLKAGTRLIRQQILRLMKNIPVVELQKIDPENPDTMKTREILQRNLTETEFIEYSVWAWMLMQIQKNNK